MARYFIDRPIFAWMLAIGAMLAGMIAIRTLPVSQFPAIAPPQIAVTATFPGADAATLERTTTQVIEQELRGIDHLRYFSAVSASAGTATITITFEQGTDPDIAQVQVQNKVQAAMPLLPQEVQRQGVQVLKSSAGFLLFVGLYSDGGEHSGSDLADYVFSRIRDPISRVSGVGEVQVFGSQYAMRVWLNPLKLRTYGLTVVDVMSALRAQNVQVSAGQIGAPPAPPGQMLNAAVAMQSRLETPEAFGAIRLRGARDAAVVRLRDVARVEMGAENYAFDVRYNGLPATGFGIRLAPGANALDTVDAVKARVEAIARDFPPDVRVIYPYDGTPIVRLSVEQVVHTLIEAVILVFFVMFLFLQNWRATIIPTIAVPVVLLGTFAVLAAAGYTINTLTLFGMVLAIGLLVDDAIVVVENVERLIVEEHLTPTEAARRSMDQIGSALVGIGTVLSAVFLPMAFFAGSTGIIYRQFSVTIVSAMILSVLVALVLTPALCATILRPHRADKPERNGISARFFRWFNDLFDRGTVRYERGVRRVAGHRKRSALVYLLIVAGVGLLLVRLPSGFLPEEDQGTVIMLVQGPPGATRERTESALATVRDHYRRAEAHNIRGVFSIAGLSFAGQGQNSGTAWINLRSWDERPGAGNRAQAMAARAMAKLRSYPDAAIFAIVPPAVRELGNATGFDMQLVDIGGIGHRRLTQAREALLTAARADHRIAQVRALTLEDAPKLRVEIDQDKAAALGLDPEAVNQTMTIAWGGAYANDFTDRGRVKRVYVQADAEFRKAPENLSDFAMRNVDGGMTPYTAFATTRWTREPVQLTRYNGLPAMQIQGVPAAGASTGTAMAAMEEMHARLPPGTALEWTGLSFEERLSSGRAPLLYGLSILIVFMCLAALYESLSVPLAVILVVPLGVAGALLAAWITGLNNDIYLQVGLITTIGVSAKNAILIVEFAEERVRGGMAPLAAAAEAARLRLRPILMTSLAFGLGVLPLALSTGAGSGGQQAIGRTVVGGMISATVLAIFFVPLFFVGVALLIGRGEKTRARGDGDT